VHPRSEKAGGGLAIATFLFLIIRLKKFDNPSETLVIGDSESIGIDTSITELTATHIEFKDHPSLTFPTSDWEYIIIDVSGLSETEKRHLEWYFDVAYLDDEWPSVDVEMSASSSIIYRWLPETTAATLGKDQTLRIPRARIEEQVKTIEQSVGRELGQDTARSATETGERLKNKIGDWNHREQIKLLREKLSSELPDWMIEANEANKQLMRLSEAISDVGDDKIKIE
jgi:gas vesicle protein